MKDGKFETQAEIWEHLLKNGKLKLSSFECHYYLKDGMFTNSEGKRERATFEFPEQWLIYEEPKPKKKVTLYRYTYREDNGPDIKQTDWCSYSFKEGWSHHFTLLKTESKEVECDDV